jgi:hypothetical protein
LPHLLRHGLPRGGGGGQTEQGRAILGVVDGFSPKGIEGEQDIAKSNPSCGLSDISFEKAEWGKAED